VLESAKLERAIASVRQRIAAAAERAGRDPAEVRLVAVTKRVSPEVVRAAAEAGIEEFGENYAQDLEGKREAAPAGVWHFVGRLQRNKVRRVLEHADIVQTLEAGAAADRLGELARERPEPVTCLVEVDFTGRRVGVSPEETPAFVERLAAMEGIRVVGLMTVPPLGEPAAPWFRRLRAIRDDVRKRVESAEHLSMGMSADYEEAVGEGATMVRVGTAIFGPRG
jgi:pyridoxal phosphate enzyme (YggS family)